MNENNKDEQLRKQVETMVERVIEIEMQYETYCQMMKEMFLSGSTNN